MKKMLFMMLTLLITVGGIQAQEVEKELTREQKKELQERLDSLMFAEAVQAIDNKMFTLEADQVVFKYGQTAYVNANTTLFR